MGDQASTGKIKFSINYKTASGLTADPAKMTSDSSLLYLVDRSKLLDVSKFASVVASDKQWGTGGLSKEQVDLLFDGNTATYGDLATAIGAYYTVDLGEDTEVRLSAINLMPRTSLCRDRTTMPSGPT